LLFSYQSQGKNISGALNVKITDENSARKMPVIIMLRGYMPTDGYYSGAGTKNVAAVLANNNYVTLAPDFLGYGQSDNEPNNTWEARLIKPLNVIDLIKTIQKFPEIDLSLMTDLPIKKISLDANKIGLWGHSNGGQIAISTLEVLGSNLPTTLWAPVLAPFPYSILYFTDENADEGKEARKYLSQFEEDYDVFDFSLTQHLDRLYGPIQIQHGTDDDSALVEWTEEFLAKIDLENERRAASASAKVLIDTNDVSANTSATTSGQQAPIKIDFYKYVGANHNLQSNWDEAVQKDLDFFKQNL
jgi:dipeptidyl aminopeptidase/acylaminoacyl peptidase